MSLHSLIDELVPYAPSGISRVGANSLAKRIQAGQDQLFDCEGYSNRYLIRTAADAMPPTMITTADTARYDATAATFGLGSLTQTIGGTSYEVRIRRVARVFVDATNVDYGRRWFGKPFLFALRNPYSNAVTQLEVVDYPCQFGDALEDTEAWIHFLEDPGTTSGVYYAECYWEPPRLDAETKPLCVPQDYEDALFDYVLGSLQSRGSGRQSELLTKFERMWVPQFQQEVLCAGGNYQRQMLVTPREC